MKRVMSATQVRINFGKVIRLAVETGPIIVERSGKAEVVILSKQAYDDLCRPGNQPKWQELLAQSQKRVQTEINGKELPAPEEFLNAEREGRDGGDMLR
jgi:prevent-host-death family protein